MGSGCVPEGISNRLEHTGENAFQQMNTPQVLVEKKTHPSLTTCVILNTSGQVITGWGFFLIFYSNLIRAYFAVDIWGLSPSFT